MTGMASGALVCSLRKKDFKDELFVFSCLELIIGCSGFISIFLYSNQSVQLLANFAGIFSNDSNLSYWIIYGFVFLSLLIPTMCMGATLPALASYAENNFKNPAKSTARLYASNTLGAFSGTILCGIYLLPAFGIRTSLLLTGLLNIAISISAFLLFKRKHENQRRADSKETTDSPEAKRQSHVFLPVVFISGLAFFAMEIIWTRFLVILFGSSTYALSCVLAMCLLGLSAGAFLSEFLSRTLPRKVLSLLLLASSIFLGICLFQFDKTPYLFLNLVSAFPEDNFARILPMVITTVWMVLIPSTLLGSIFPYTLSLIDKGSSSISRSTARLLATNIVGTITGAALGFLLFQCDFTHLYKSSIQTGTTVITILLLLTGTIVLLTSYFQDSKKGRLDLTALILAFLAILTVMTRPTWNEKLMTVGYFFISPASLKSLGVDKTIQSFFSDNDFLYYREGSNATIAVKRNKKNNLSILTANGKVEASIPIKRSFPSPFADLTTHTLLGLSASIFCPNNNQEALVIGYGSGTTCGSTTKADWVKSTTVIDIDQSIFSTDQYFQPSNLVPLKFSNLKSQKTTPVVADARNHLIFSNSKYDVIVSQPSEPWISGSSNMYTSEFFSLVNSRLKEGGVFGQWIQLYSISEGDLRVLINTFQSQFKNAFIIHPTNAGELILLGTKSNAPISYEQIDNRIKSKSIRNLLNQVGITDTTSYLSMITHNPQDLNNLNKDFSLLNTDNNLYSEFHMGKKIIPNDQSIEKLKSWLCRMPAPENNSSTLIDHLSKKDNDTARQLALEIARKNFATNLPCSDQDLYITYSSNKSSPKSANCPLQFVKIKNLIGTMDDDSKIVIGARIYQMVNSNLFKKSYEELKTKNLVPKEDGFLEAVLARFRYEEKNPEKAVQHALNVTQKNTKNPEAFLMAGKVLLYSGHYKEAIEKIDYSIKLGNRSYESLSNLALALYLNGNSDRQVIPLLEESCLLNPNQYIARYLLGVLNLKNDKLYPGLAQMIYASQVSGADSSTNVYVTAAFIKIHHWVNAKQNLKNLEKKDPESQYIPILKYEIAKGENNEALQEKLLKQINKNNNTNLNATEIQSLNKVILDSPVPHLMSLAFKRKLKEFKNENQDTQ